MAASDSGLAPVSAVLGEASPLVHLDELAACDLLGDFKRVYVPEVVWAELAHHRPQALRRQGVRLQRVALGEEPDDAFMALVQALSLGEGDQQAIQLARQHAPAVLLTDDAAARLAGEAFSLPVHGTLGLLVRAVRRQQRTPEAVLSLLEQLPQHCSLHLRGDLLASVIEQFQIAHDLQ